MDEQINVIFGTNIIDYSNATSSIPLLVQQKWDNI